MKKNLLILAALLTLHTMSVNAQTETSANAKCGQTVTITATPDPGYKFLYWDDDHSLTNPTRDVTIDANTSVYDYVAVFDIATYTLVVKTEQTDMGSVTGGGEHAFGDNVQIAATPKNKCYQFKQWSDGNTDNPRNITIGATDTENTYIAEFEEVEFTITVGGSNGSVTIAQK